MLHVFIHSGALDERNPGNQLAVLDIAYAKRSYMADYDIALLVKGYGEARRDAVKGYPRWSGSLWDLVARALTRALYEADEAPPAGPVDRRCAYATKLCIAVFRSTAEEGPGFEIATGEIVQAGKRGLYTVNLEEDILGRRSATFEYGTKRLVHADLVLRALCWALFGKDTLGRRPALILPPAIKVDGVERFDIENLEEPARTGFDRYRAPAGTTSPDPMPKAEDYARFLTRG
ncbi:hypothetical protein RAMLITH_17480 [Ramlibacter sp. RBP-2]|uniref:Uncharacterized protein n=1 Tax=Ramlibacter lithotrophicus TaxID=2606681 RepID=A0A7X6DI55_9BURK|nr:hypothetical protein [Ramlibacter lithotrophicus]NKE67617.1 hypothetical protein [Ramlibacter lithotrophicus]